MTETEKRWTDNEEVKKMLDGITDPRCSECGGPARMPEDCLAILEKRGERYPFFLCSKEECWKTFESKMKTPPKED